jgi:ribose transport system permease protein
MNQMSLKKRVGAIPPAIWLILVMLVFYGSNTKNYFSMGNFLNIVVQAAPLFVVACGQTIIVLMQGTDLSLGASLNMMTVVWVVLMQKSLPLGLALAIAMACSVLAGFLNGVIVAKMKLPPFIATLGMQNILNSIALVTSNGSSVYFQHTIYKTISKGTALGIPYIVWIAIACFLLTFVLLKYTRFGARIVSMGGNPESLRVAGYSIDTATIQAFTYTGFMTAIAGFLLACRVESGNPIVGNGFEFNSVAAVLLGGTSMREGRGGVAGTVFGVLLIQILKSGLVMMNVSSIYQTAIIGVVVLFAIVLDAYIKRRQEARL